jgi:predicted acyltransferase
MTTTGMAPSRIASFDQFRGYTVLGMFIVNFLGSYAVIHPLLKHNHTYCSYADTIMPQFFFAVGFSFRLSFLKRTSRDGKAQAYWHAVRRNAGLLLVGFVIHHLDGRYDSWSRLADLGFVGFIQEAFQRSFFQTLTHIALTSLWVLPVVAVPSLGRVVFAVLSGLLHVLISYQGYYTWVLARPGIDGGPLGFLTWTIPLVVGTVACDAMSWPSHDIRPFAT